MEASTRTAESYYESIVSLIEQYLTASREAMDTLKTELANYLGPNAVSAIIDRLPPWQPPQFPPPLLVRMATQRSKPEIVERIKRIDVQVKLVILETQQMEKVMEHLTWMWGWAHHSPLHDYLDQVIVKLQCYVTKRRDAVKSFRTSWEPLKMKLARSPPSDTCPPEMSNDDWLLTMQQFQQMNLVE